MLSNKTLYKIAVYGAVFTASSGFFFYWRIQEDIKNSEYFVTAMRILRSHKPSVYLLGEPIKAGRLDLDDREKNYCDGLRAKFEVPVRGPKQKGTLYFAASRIVAENRWVVHNMELELSNDSTKRLRIISCPEGET
ncbi:cytochrome c oxidase assembly factor 1 homolog [Hetaerina americana]|uniref:cytochrome c oxidase assembly factor 1 homolog n=1 Tax=Hetaerina americana TaxID=62018 RepID=UPI003A7F22BD